MTRPIVAIVGRPNVGKSTLFNRLVGKRLAIIEDIPGTTRDRVYADISWGEHQLTLVDTGGLEVNPQSDIRQMVKNQVEIAIRESDVIIFLVDVRQGVTIPDIEVAQALRCSEKPILLAVNKVDNEPRRDEALQFYELAISDPIPISAYHNIGVDELMEGVLAKLPVPSAEVEEAEMMKVAIVGRPNVGKSMLLNAILGQERVIVDEAPGTTRDAIDTVFRHDNEPVVLIDTAGIRKRGRVERGIEQYSVLRALHAIARADIVLLVTEVAEPITAQDTHIAGYIEQAFKGMVLVVNKWDLAGDRDQAQTTKEIRRRLKFVPYVPILHISAKLEQGIDQVLASAKMVYQERFKRLATPLLNNVVSEALVSHAPPAVTGKRLNILYATQAEVNPPTFVFFVNDKNLLHFSYERYLENRLRKAFGFHGTPLRLIFKNRGEA